MVTDNCELFSGGFHVVCNSSGTGPHGRESDEDGEIIEVIFDLQPSASGALGRGE